jgi:hypothetical protein
MGLQMQVGSLKQAHQKMVCEHHWFFLSTGKLQLSFLITCFLTLYQIL